MYCLLRNKYIEQNLTFGAERDLAHSRFHTLTVKSTQSSYGREMFNKYTHTHTLTHRVVYTQVHTTTQEVQTKLHTYTHTQLHASGHKWKIDEILHDLLIPTSKRDRPKEGRSRKHTYTHAFTHT